MLGLRPWIFWSMIGAFVLTLSFAGCEHRNASTAREERDLKILELSSAIEANSSNVTTISSLKKANEDLAKLVTPSAEMKQLAERAAANLIEVAQREKALREKEEKDYAKPDCLALLNSDLAVCPNIVNGLRERAAGNQNGHGGGKGSGGGEVRP